MHLQQDNNSMTMHDRTPTKGPLETGLCRNAPTTTPPHTPPPVGERERAEREEVNIDRIECNIDRVDKKKKLKSDSVRWTLATQNFRGLTSEEAREEVALQMERASIDIVCGQETWMADCRAERWDTGEVYINYGRDFEGKASGRSEGVCFILNKRMAAAFEKGGKRTKKYCPRLATIRIPISRQEQLYIVNAHAPDSGQSKARRMGFQRRLDAALEDCKEGETLVMVGDFNASTGISSGENDDGVTGPHGLEHQNEAGRDLKLTAAMYGLVDLVSFEDQKFHGTWMHGRSKKWHQLDKVFMREVDRHKVKKCINAEMLLQLILYSTLFAIPHGPMILVLCVLLVATSFSSNAAKAPFPLSLLLARTLLFHLLRPSTCVRLKVTRNPFAFGFSSFYKSWLFLKRSPSRF